MQVRAVRQTDNYIPDSVRAVMGLGGFAVPSDIVFGNGLWSSGEVRNTLKRPKFAKSLGKNSSAIFDIAGTYTEIGVRDKDGNYLAVSPLKLNLANEGGLYQSAEVRVFSKASAIDNGDKKRNVDLSLSRLIPVEDSASQEASTSSRSGGLSSLKQGVDPSLAEDIDQKQEDEPVSFEDNIAGDGASLVPIKIGFTGSMSFLDKKAFLPSLRQSKMDIGYGLGMYLSVSVFTRVSA